MTSSYIINNPNFLFINDIIPHSGQFNMEFDQWLFQLMKNNNVKNVLRIYEWDMPCITYGKFQQIEKQINKEACREDNIDLVKRPTGGRAILHFNEITFSMVFSSKTISPYNFRNSFLFAGDLITSGFAFLNIKASISLKMKKYQNKSLCFQSTTQYEIIDNNANKLAGIAQYFTKKGVLIQGSIPLKENPEYKKYFRVKNEYLIQNSLIGTTPGRKKVRKALIKGFQKKLNLNNLI